MHRARMLVIIVLAACATLPVASGQTPRGKTAEQWIADFSKSWDDLKWEKSFRTAPDGYIRPLNDEGWKVRMRALQGVVAQGRNAIPSLLAALKSEDVPRRIFAAQALGYLGPNAPTAALLDAAKSDPDAAVRLYAVDALAMQGDKTTDIASLLSAEQNRDVTTHLRYAQQRHGVPVETAIVKQLVDWDSATIDSAKVGKKAPDFELMAAQGDLVKLSSFVGKSAVVLVFVYGDT